MCRWTFARWNPFAFAVLFSIPSLFLHESQTFENLRLWRKIDHFGSHFCSSLFSRITTSVLVSHSARRPERCCWMRPKIFTLCIYVRWILSTSLINCYYRKDTTNIVLEIWPINSYLSIIAKNHTGRLSSIIKKHQLISQTWNDPYSRLDTRRMHLKYVSWNVTFLLTALM